MISEITSTIPITVFLHKSDHQSYKVTSQMKATREYFAVELFTLLYQLAFETVDKMLTYDQMKMNPTTLNRQPA